MGRTRENQTDIEIGTFDAHKYKPNTIFSSFRSLSNEYVYATYNIPADRTLCFVVLSVCVCVSGDVRVCINILLLLYYANTSYLPIFYQDSKQRCRTISAHFVCLPVCSFHFGGLQQIRVSVSLAPLDSLFYLYVF